MVIDTRSVSHFFVFQSMLVSQPICMESCLFSFRSGQAETLTHFSIEIPLCKTVQLYVRPSGLVQYGTYIVVPPGGQNRIILSKNMHILQLK